MSLVAPFLGENIVPCVPSGIDNQPTIVLLHKDGTMGSRFKITKRITFGREHPANIRIKSNTVSGEHAAVDMDCDGVVRLCIPQECHLIHP